MLHVYIDELQIISLTCNLGQLVPEVQNQSVTLRINLCEEVDFNTIFSLLTATCTDPTPINGQISPSGLYNGRYRIFTTISVTCDTGFIVLGDHLTTCQTSGTWNPQPAACIGNTIN